MTGATGVTGAGPARPAGHLVCLLRHLISLLSNIIPKLALLRDRPPTTGGPRSVAAAPPTMGGSQLVVTETAVAVILR